MPAARGAAQSFVNLHTFAGSGGGGEPMAGLILSGSTLYGTSSAGPGSSAGSVFALSTSGTGFINLYNFSAGAFTSAQLYTNQDGSSPGSLTLSGSTLFGTASMGGNLGLGTVFALSTNGTGYHVLYAFTGTNSDGANPTSGLILSGNTLYGTAASGGKWGYGTVFAVNTDGMGFTNLHSFAGSDGSVPAAGLVLSGGTLYGTTSSGGSAGKGIVFAISTNGGSFTTLHNFSATIGAYPGPYYNGEGANPQAGLVVSGGILYGTAENAGLSGSGTVFALKTDGTSFTTLHNFTASAYPGYTNSDGAFPDAGLTLAGGTLYGTTYFGSSSGHGTVFAVSTNGAGFTNLYGFSAGTYSSTLNTSTNSDGAFPNGLMLAGNHLYGTTHYGGVSAYGTIFVVNLAPSLGILRTGNQVVLSWPAGVPVYGLQSAINPNSPANWSAVFPEPVVVNGQNVVTNPIAGSQNYFRLSQ